MTKPLTLAIIGAGALTESVYLPVLRNNKAFSVACIIDINKPQALKMAEKYQIPKVLESVDDIKAGEIEVAIVVLPNYLHASVSISLIQKGIHVLVEKPMANTLEECMELIRQSQERNVRLAVGLVRRFYPTTISLKEIIDSNVFGKLKSFDFQEGHIFEWKLQSDYLLSKSKAGGGVLVDTGVHMLDQMIYCIGYPLSVEYYDDNRGGVESDCAIKVQMQDGVKGIVQFSRIRKLGNSMILNFENAEIEMGLNANSTLDIRINGVNEKLNALVNHKSINGFKNKDAFNAQLDDLADAVNRNRPCQVNGEEGMLSVKLIEQCYASRKPISFFKVLNNA